MAASAFKAVPNPVHGLNLDTCANGLEAPSEEIDIVVKIAVLHLGVRPPYVRQYQPPGKHLSGIAYQVFQKGGFPPA